MKKTFLKEILNKRKQDIEHEKNVKPLKILIEQCMKLPEKKKDFKKAITRKSKETIKIIGEIKRASPSKGFIRKKLNPVIIAKIYETQNINAISVLTENSYFKGHIEDLRAVSNTVKIPILRKDFIIDEYQIYESKLNHADAILLIVAVLKKSEINKFIRTANAIGMDVLVEVHNERELKIALDCHAAIIGINNRNLKTFKVDLKTCFKLSKKIPPEIVVVVESGILNRREMKLIEALPVDAVLIGEAFMKAKNIIKKIKELKYE